MSDEIPVLGCTCNECTDARLNLEFHSQRHEFHMLDAYNAYCICGWQGSEDRSTDLGERYRDHLV